MQKINIIGHIGRDAKVYDTVNGRKFASFSVAANSQRGTDEKTTWYSVMWYNYSEKMLKYLKAGKPIAVGGDLDINIKVDTTTGTQRLENTVSADYVNFINIGKKEEGERSEEEPTTKAEKPKKESKKTVAESEDEPVVAKKAPVASVTPDDDLPF